jgi:N-acetylglutamate synthase-like GNAT family acetyltransferase
MQKPKLPQDERVCVVRQARRSDCEEIAELCGQLGYSSTAEEIRNRLGEMRDPSHHAVYVAELQDGSVVGWIGICVFRAVAVESFAEISGLIVDEAMRSRGIGKALLNAAQEWTRHAELDVLTVRTNVLRDRAHRFYETSGFELLKTQKVFRKRL